MTLQSRSDAHPCTVVPVGEWKAKNILRAERKRWSVDCRGPSEQLIEAGTSLTEQGADNRTSEGGFSVAFFVQCLKATGLTDERL